MRFPARCSLLALAIATVIPALASAQGVELGIDAEFDHYANSPSVTVISIPTAGFRAGFGLNRNVTFEPRVSFQYAQSQGNHATSIDLQLGFPWQFRSGRARTSGYARPFFNYTRLSSGSGSASQSGLGAGLGLRIPKGNHFALRMEAGFMHALENNTFASSDLLYAMFGVSFFTR